ncbi:MAG: hypothetical protein R3F11_31515 [Verrucomicrobiales bacterium]
MDGASEVRVRVTDQFGAFAEAAFTITLPDLPRRRSKPVGGPQPANRGWSASGSSSRISPPAPSAGSRWRSPGLRRASS